MQTTAKASARAEIDLNPLELASRMHQRTAQSAQEDACTFPVFEFPDVLSPFREEQPQMSTVRRGPVSSFLAGCR
jgi:hypothetical protein